MMSETSVERIEELLKGARGMPASVAKVAHFEEAVRIADVLQEVQIAYDLRHELLWIAHEAGQLDTMTTAFTWCLGQSDHEPQRFPEVHLIHMYRVVIFAMLSFPQVTRGQFDAMFDDLRNRSERAGATLRSFYMLRRNIAFEMDDGEEARRMHEAFSRSKRDWSSDSALSELSNLIEWYGWEKRDAEAIAIAAPILAGRMRDTGVTMYTWPNLIMPALRTGDYDLLMRCYAEGYPLIARKPRSVRDTGRYMLLLATTHNFAAGIKLLESHVPHALAQRSLADRHEVFCGAYALCESLVRHTPDVVVRVPDVVAPKGSRIEVVRDRFRELTSQLSDPFDARNGNDYFHRRMAEFIATLDLGRPHPLPRSSFTGGKSQKYIGTDKY